jgi:hypothetical protein
LIIASINISILACGDQALLKATIGSSFAALWAGTTPKNRPIPPEIPTDKAIAAGETVAAKGDAADTIATAPMPIKIPITPPAA